MKIITNLNVSEIVPLIDKKWLFSGIWHLKGSLEEGERALKNLEENISSYGFEPKLIYKKFSAKYDKGDLRLFSDVGEEISKFEFNDVIFEKFSKSRPVSDEIVLLSATVGDKIKNTISKFHSESSYKDYFYLSGYAAGLAEAITEYGYRKACEEYGFDYASTFRLSPGYPAWPNLSDQLKISDLLSLDKIGVEVSEALQLHPEYSTTAMIFKLEK